MSGECSCDLSVRQAGRWAHQRAGSRCWLAPQAMHLRPALTSLALDALDTLLSLRALGTCAAKRERQRGVSATATSVRVRQAGRWAHQRAVR